ncbi:MAG: alpha/beta fold hydrolase [Bacteroidota bacterium]
MKTARRVRVAGIPEGFRESSFAAGDVTLNYVAGPDHGLPLLLIPGQMESWQGYKRVLPELSKGFQVFVPDLRGHGKSTWTQGRYSYNICGNDLKHFIREVIQRPAIVSGLSSGGVLALWLAANAPGDVLAVIAEDPPIFSSVWPRIQNEKFLVNNFRNAVDILGRPGERDLEAYFAEMGAPMPGKTELLKIPRFIVSAIFLLYRLNRALRPKSPYDAPLLPYNIRAGFKFLSEYDTDFSRATIDGELSRDFDPEETLRGVKCPMLLLRVPATRHETWGILGAIDDDDLKCIVSLVDDLKVVEIPGAHEMHLVKPGRYIDELISFVDNLRMEGKLPDETGSAPAELVPSQSV